MARIWRIRRDCKYKASELYGGPGLTAELQKEYDAYIKKRTEELKNGTKK
jgi:hypothetical protein